MQEEQISETEIPHGGHKHRGEWYLLDLSEHDWGDHSITHPEPSARAPQTLSLGVRSMNLLKGLSL